MGRKDLFLLDNDAKIAEQFRPFVQTIKHFTYDPNFTGDIAYTGIGFEPTFIEINSVLRGTLGTSTGFGDSVTSNGVYTGSAGTWSYSNTNVATLIASLGVESSASLASLDADGFTLNWVKFGAQINFADLIVRCIR